eukprot:scaffold52098_cov37-Tisochrysis_lutea.AAC.4
MSSAPELVPNTKRTSAPCVAHSLSVALTVCWRDIAAGGSATTSSSTPQSHPNPCGCMREARKWRNS